MRANREPSRAAGCGAVFGVALVLVGGTALLINLLGFGAVVPTIARVAGFLAVWWPAGLVLWGAFKLTARFRNRSPQVAFGEGLLVVLYILFGTALTAGHAFSGRHDLGGRFAEISGWADSRWNPDPERTFVEERSFELAAGRALLIEAPRGAIRVAPAEPPGSRTVSATLAKRARAASDEEAARLAAGVRLSTARESAGADSDSPFRIAVNPGASRDVGLDLAVRAPEDARVIVRTGRGAVEVRGGFPGVAVTANGGAVEIAGAAGDVSLQTRGGDARISDVAGAVTVRSRHATVDVSDARGPVSVEADGAPVWVVGVDESVTVATEGAPATVARVGGATRVSSNVAPVTLEQIAGEARVRGAHAPVFATGISGPLEIRGAVDAVEVARASGGIRISGTTRSIRLEEVAGPVEISADGAAAWAEGVRGDARVSGAGDALFARDVLGGLSVRSSSADIHVIASRLAGPIGIDSGHGDVFLSLPETAFFRLAAATSDGDVESDFRLERAEERDESGRRVWTAAVPGPGPGEPASITISSRTGDIEVRRAGEEPR